MSDIPTLLMGDFNEDVLGKSDYRIRTLMSSLGYEQLVQSPTTDRGTLIDHIYYNRAREHSVILDVCDTYYSDHDTICCSLPL